MIIVTLRVERCTPARPHEIYCPAQIGRRIGPGICQRRGTAGTARTARTARDCPTRPGRCSEFTARLLHHLSSAGCQRDTADLGNDAVHRQPLNIT